LREAQAIASDKVKKAGVAVITDAGDLGDIHPQKKEPAGARLALLALANDTARRSNSAGLPISHSRPMATRRSCRSITSAAGWWPTSSRWLALRTLAPMAGWSALPWRAKTRCSTGDGDHRRRHRRGDQRLGAEADRRPIWLEELPRGEPREQAGLPASPFRSDDWLPKDLK